MVVPLLGSPRSAPSVGASAESGHYARPGRRRRRVRETGARGNMPSACVRDAERLSRFATRSATRPSGARVARRAGEVAGRDGALQCYCAAAITSGSVDLTPNNGSDSRATAAAAGTPISNPRPG